MRGRATGNGESAYHPEPQARDRRRPERGLRSRFPVPSSLVSTKSYGFADMSTHRLANRQSVYRIGSITKMFTGIMLQQLVAAGKIRLTDPVERYYPEIKEIRGYAKLAAPITVQQLATMTSGISREPEEEGPTAQRIRRTDGRCTTSRKRTTPPPQRSAGPPQPRRTSPRR